MRIFNNVEIINVKGRVNIAIVNIPSDDELPTRDEIVLINDRQCIVSAVECQKGLYRKPTVGIVFRDSKPGD